MIGAILTALHDRNFFSTGNIRAILTFTSVLGFIAIGQTLVILVGSLDLSVPFVTSLSSVVAGGIMAGESGNVPQAVAVTHPGRRRHRPGQRPRGQPARRARLRRDARAWA